MVGVRLVMGSSLARALQFPARPSWRPSVRGEISYPAVARALADMGYAGTVGLEAWTSGDSEAALTRFREAFTL
jgi:hydroxypyruvate isomerase